MRDVFPFDAAKIFVLDSPKTPLTPEEYDVFVDWLELVKRRIKRAIKVPTDAGHIGEEKQGEVTP